MYPRLFAAIASTLLASGCAIHPVPEDVTGLRTEDIVKQIRCETRDAARTMIRDKLEDLGRRNDEMAAALAVKYKNDPELMVAFDAKKLFPGAENLQIRNYFEIIYATAIAYAFELQMTETNNLNPSTSKFLGPWSPSLNLDIGGSGDRQRTNVRTFTITDELKFLLTDLNTENRSGRYCDNRIVGPNYIYPMAGKIGVYNTLHTFLQLSLIEHLAPDRSKAFGKDPSPLADKLQFTTEVSLSATPTVTFAPVRSQFQITSTTATGKLSRKDMHQVILGLAVDSSAIPALTSMRDFIFSGPPAVQPGAARLRRRDTQPSELRSVIAPVTSRAAEIALRMVDQIRSREIQLIPPP
ncbi:hypothetical protein [Tardiphaga sp. OK245]|jgi:hypothetical protein|uniref:hypothetical protein n=1 Tax=Tardiphaga sp. OK245 TaxID=1855306 RepID=UPI0008A7FF80|nr:hypothetical protein [Tardiphaga sp. OK245]SEI16822.1 hypothetical protein SAMN05216367_4450 [Tardiphaga sp. OK245]